MNGNRNYGIDLLRIVLMYMICVFHVLKHGGILNQAGKEMLLLKELCVCAVDAYAMISGYFVSDRPLNHKRLLKLWFTALFYLGGIALGIFLIHSFLGFGSALSTEELLHSFLPFCYGNWYFRAYMITAFLTPLLNRTLVGLNKDKSRKLFVLFVLIYSAATLINDDWSGKGYSPIWLLLLYVIGALIRKAELFSGNKKGTLVLFYVLSCLLTWLMSDLFGFSRWNTYTSPSVLFSAIFLVLIFAKIDTDMKAVRLIAPLTFGIYLFHDNQYVRMYFIEDRFASIAFHPLPVAILLTLAGGLLVFLLSLIVEVFRTWLFRLLRIDALCDRIIHLFQKIADRI